MNFFDDLPEDAQRIIANMMFNLGRPRLTKFRKMYEAVMDANWMKPQYKWKIVNGQDKYQTEQKDFVRE